MMRAWRNTGFMFGSFALAAPAFALVTVTYEKPGQQKSGADFSLVGVEDFEGEKTGKDRKFKTDFGTGGLIKGTYRDVQIDPANQYGSTGGSGNHASTFSTSGYSLALESKVDGGVTYFGYWLSALDGNNELTLLSGGKEIFVFTPKAVLGAIGGEQAYFGNPDMPFEGQNRHEPYAFVNFFSDLPFDEVRFRQIKASGGYESDNHSVGQWVGQSGAMVPEPTTWVMMLSGFGFVGWALRRQRRLATA